jgi:hypothetical protein
MAIALMRAGTKARDRVRVSERRWLASVQVDRCQRAPRRRDRSRVEERAGVVQHWELSRQVCVKVVECGLL